MTFKRTKLADRMLPNYSVGEEIMNTVTHIVGGAMGVAALSLCVTFAALHRNIYGVVCSAIYGFCMIALYSVSSVYHGLKPGMGKKVMQVIDHCTIYFLICGTYTVIALSGRCIRSSAGGSPALSGPWRSLPQCSRPLTCGPIGCSL